MEPSVAQILTDQIKQLIGDQILQIMTLRIENDNLRTALESMQSAASKEQPTAESTT